MKKYTILLITMIVAAVTGLSSCIGDLNVTPIDPNLVLPEDVLNTESAFEQVLAKCYGGLAVSASEGPDSDADISGIDGGFGQYMRALFYLNELPSDEASICWNDQTIADLHRLKWTSSDVFVTAMFSRMYYQIGLCNELIRRAKASDIKSTNMDLYIAEARALRALSYYHAIDMFGNVPFATDENSVGSTGPEQIMRADLYAWLVDEIIDFTPSLKPIGTNEYGRVDQGFAKMLLAKMYLNAGVYTDGKVTAWSECAAVCKEIMNAYPALHNKYTELFLADNNLRTNEIIFAVESDGVNTQTYGATTFVIKASIVSGNAEWQAYLGVNDGWGGVVVTPNFISLFDKTMTDVAGNINKDSRYMFFEGYNVDDETRHQKDIDDDKVFTNGWVSHKFKNLKSDGSAAKAQNFPDTDYPIFRTADAYLMLAECAKKGGVSESEGLIALNAVRERAGIDAVSSYSLDDVLDERGRELYWENFRRSDLIRFGKYTGDSYIWQWKGGTRDGQSVDSKYVLFPIPTSEINSNSKLVQNAGY